MKDNCSLAQLETTVSHLVELDLTGNNNRLADKSIKQVRTLKKHLKVQGDEADYAGYILT